MSKQRKRIQPGKSSSKRDSAQATPGQSLQSANINASPSGRRWRVAAVGLVCGLLAAGGLLWWNGLGDQDSSVIPPDFEKPGSSFQRLEFPLTPISTSPFLNTGSVAHYVGSESCLPCHQGRTASFRRTGMGCSMAEVDPAVQPPDAVFDHAASKRRYQVIRKDRQLWHRELLLTDRPEEIVLSEYPLKYVLGSGHSAHTYVVEAEGFLLESPITWYSARKAWGMSPGYDQPHHSSFGRGIGEMCLYCHVGRAEPVDRNENRMRVLEPTIGCERCHGPGSLHVAEHTKGQNGVKKEGGAVDHTIVNPTHLSRELAEAICQQCHFTGATTVMLRGRRFSDYRPGLPLEDFRQTFVMSGDQTAMTVVGHVEQLHMSRCYKESATLTCTTCHAPHAMPRPEEREAHYRAVCLSCHQPQACTVDHQRQLRESPTNNCVLCHMPNAATEVPHVAFSHHRIGIHTKLAEEHIPDSLPGEKALHPVVDNARLSDVDRKRSLGLAYLSLAEVESKPGLRAQFQNRGFELLTTVQRAGLRDAVVEAVVAGLHFQRSQDDALVRAQSALALPDIMGVERCTVLFIVASERYKRKQYQEAVTALREVVTLRRRPEDWVLLGECQRKLGNLDAGMQALESAVRINPRLVQAHQILAQYYTLKDNPHRAAWHQQRAVP
jgi:predicted CXXCH cytochrome family protein